ncbi:L-rhamnose isomerase [Lacticaseibacillus daqingensis]|uniref:L-rhamnose isomerase n=1 Tax=Lacticaseibacillus daqingensis TaxID=2486014 RepID=UPI000F787F78|nr:L-rhamnose isomerase [Lacticaseibacillus daqingensis]
MTQQNEIEQAYDLAREQYQRIGVDTDQAMARLAQCSLALHCWQGDDVQGFLTPDQPLSGGIAVSGQYPGRARTPAELAADLAQALKLIPGHQHKVALHAMYAVVPKPVDVNDVEPEDFDFWIDWALAQGVGLDFNGTFMANTMMKDNLTLTSPDPAVRAYWIAHGKLARRIADYMGQRLGQQVINNLWIPDGSKDNPISKRGPRERLLTALDEIEATPYPEAHTIDAFEGKLFGTGIESYTAGSHLFYNNYALTRGKLWTIDAGHWHPTEDVSDKFSAVLPFASKGLYMHVSRPVRWDSDHVVILDDALMNIAHSLVRDDYLSRVHLGLDFFDATINRIAAWVVGARAMQQALLQALLEPTEALAQAERAGDFTTRLVTTEGLKSYPFGAVWDKFCADQGVPVGLTWLSTVRAYEQQVLAKR